MAFCSNCDKQHDFDAGPDVGSCLFCGGFLIESASEAINIAQNFSQLIQEAYVKLALARKDIIKEQS